MDSRHCIKEDAECLLGGGFGVRAIVTFAEMEMALFAFVALFAGDNAFFNKLLSRTPLAH